MYIYTGSETVGNINYVKYENYDFHTIPHVHRDFELVYVIEDSVNAVVDGIPVVATAGACILILPHQIHSYSSTSQSSSIVLNFSGELISTFMSILGSNTVDCNVFYPDDVTHLLIQRMLLENPSPTICDQKCLLYAICSNFMKSAKFIPRQYPDNAPAYRVIHYISEHYREDLSLKSIAKELGYDYHYLSRAFSKTTNVSFRDFVNYHRIECARSLLRDTNTSISEIALDCGFQTIRSFNRAFQEIMHVTPMQFRNNSTQEG